MKNKTKMTHGLTDQMVVGSNQRAKATCGPMTDRKGATIGQATTHRKDWARW